MKDLIKEVYGPRNFNDESEIEDIVHEKMSESPLNEYLAGVIIPSCYKLDDNANDKSPESEYTDEETGFSQVNDDENTEAFNFDASIPSEVDPRLRTKSFGISFYIESDNPKFSVCSTWGRYDQVRDENDKVKYYERSSFYNITEIDFKKDCNEGYFKTNINDSDEEIELYVKSVNLEENVYFISIYLVNKINLEDPRSLDIGKCLFQPSIRVKISGEYDIPKFNLKDYSENTLEFLYRERPIYARGHMCSAIWDEIDYIDELGLKILWPDGLFHEKNDSDLADFKYPHIRSEFVPVYPMPRSLFDEPNGIKMEFKSKILSELWNNDDIDDYLNPLINEYENWILKNKNKSEDEKEFKEISDEIIGNEEKALKRIKQGIDLIKNDLNVRLAFCFANKSIDLQSSWIRGEEYEFIWRPFQLAFFLMNIESIVNEDSDCKNTLDLLWISTGGGKTEAYLGIMAFTMAYRRITSIQNGESGAGTSILSRYTLRLLTVQQFRRTLVLVTATEFLRTYHENDLWGWRPKNSENYKNWIYGTTRFSVGMWVGYSVTPNKLFAGNTSAISCLVNPEENFNKEDVGNPAQIVRCPVCNSHLAITKEGIPKEKEAQKLHLIVANDEDIEPKNEIVKNSFEFIENISINSNDLDFESLTIIIQFINESISFDKLRKLKDKLDELEYDVLSLSFFNPGYFATTTTPRGKIIDYEIFCPDSDCPLNNHEWMEGFPIDNGETKLSDGNFPRKISHTHFLGTNRMPIPGYTVDEHVYSKCPTVIISTADKIARLAFEPKAASIFGNVSHFNEYYGYHRELVNGNDYTNLINESIVLKNKLKPLDLIIQDELHLIDGPLGSLFGLYEFIVDSIIKSNGGNPKYIASTATIKNTELQSKRAFSKELFQFPPYGLTIDDNFFVREDFEDIWNEKNPGRIYMGVYSPGRGPLTPQIRLWSRIFDTSERNKLDENIVYYWTLVGYYNSMRELGGGGALYREDILERLKQIKSSRKLSIEPFELSSRLSSTEIPLKLSEIELDGENKEEIPNIDAILSTSMFGTGVDVGHLSLMIVNGQPKTTSSYIQATGRIGRSHGGLVVTFFKAGRPRDLDHYETFPSYHHRLHLGVEPVSVSPFSEGALKKALGPAIVSYLRNSVSDNYEWINKDNGLFIKNSYADIDIENLKNFLENRLRLTGLDEREKIRVLNSFNSQIDDWKSIELNDDENLYYNENLRYKPFPEQNVVLGDIKHNKPNRKLNKKFKAVYKNAPQSLRDIEDTIGFWV